MTSRRHSFTIKTNAIQDKLISPCSIYAAWTPERATLQPPRRQFNALWDTGATGSMITKRVVEDLGLQVEGYTTVYHVQGEAESVPLFYVNLVLFRNFHFAGVTVVLGELLDTDVLVGMDIINKGDFAVSNRNGATSFSFRIPSVENFDFAAEDYITDSSAAAGNGDHESW